MTVSILLVVDNPYRELRGLFALQAKLKQLGVRSLVVSKNSCKLAFDLYRPKIVVVPRVSAPFIEFIREASQSAIICFLPCEHAAGSELKFVLHVTGRDLLGKGEEKSAYPFVDQVYLPGENHYRWLKSGGVFKDAQMKVTGTLNSDHWFFSKKETIQKSFKVGIATTNKSFLFGSPTDSIMSSLEYFNMGDWSENLWRIEHASYEMAHMSLVLDFATQLQQKDIAVSFRCHPHEYLPNWKRFIKRSPQPFELNRDVLLENWFSQIAVTVASFSTTSFDSIANQVPCISLDRLIPEQFIERLPREKKPPVVSEMAWRPKSLEEAFQLIEKAGRGELALAPDMETVSRFLKSNFNYPRKQLACEMIAEALASLEKNPVRTRQDKTEVTVKKSKAFCWRRSLKYAIAVLPLGKMFLLLVCDLLVSLQFARRNNLYHGLRRILIGDAKKWVRQTVMRRK